MKLDAETREQIMQRLLGLPPESLREVEEFLDFLHYKQERREGGAGVALGGILAGYRFTEEEIADARREMWSGTDDNSQ